MIDHIVVKSKGECLANKTLSSPTTEKDVRKAFKHHKLKILSMAVTEGTALITVKR
jgi:hypothetical protein